MAKLGALVWREVREALPAFLLFFAAFHMIAVTKSVTLEDHAITATGTAVATVGALIVAKAVLLVERLPLSRLFSGRAIYNILWKTLLFGAVATLFRGVEELIRAAARHGGLVGDAEQMIVGVSWPHFFVMQMWLLALLLAYSLVAYFARIIGTKRIRAVLLEQTAETSIFD